MSTTPFVVGQWVRGDKFYGRKGLIEEIVHGNRNWLWLLGTRRIGKTSLLKQIEHLTANPAESGYFPLFWDFQGSADPQELHMGFSDSLLDAEERLEEIGLPLDGIEGDNLFRSMGRLRRGLRSKGLKLLLLCDEVEELIKLSRKDPALLGRLRRAMQSAEDIRSVLASTIRLWELSRERGDTSPFLHGFSPPLYIHNLSDDEARELVTQANLPDNSRPTIDERTVETIREHCDNHPYLIQLLGKRFLELGDIEESIDHVAADPMLSFFFSVDFEMLSDPEQTILRIIAENDASTSNTIQDNLAGETGRLDGYLHRLEHLGYVRKNPRRQYVLINYFFRRWFRDLSRESASSDRPRIDMDSTVVDNETVTILGFDGRYDLLERLGKGATGEVFKAWDTILRTHIAIKLLKPEYAEHEESLERLRREVLLSRDISHANIVKIYHLGDGEGRKYLTLQWIDGPTLSRVIREDAPFSIDRAVRVTRVLADALGAAHACNVLHRDIKPQNILLDVDDLPHLTDFGLARLVGGPGMTHRGAFLGTPNYAAPEQAARKSLDRRSDIHALGIILFEMVTGRRPFVGETTDKVLAQIRQTDAPDPREFRPEVSSELAAVIACCLAKDPSRRYQSAYELRDALDSIPAESQPPNG